jgi:glycine cleavage system H protein
MNVPENLKYTEEHEWISVDGDIATVGITDYAQGELGDIVFVELPDIGFETKKMEPFGTIEAVKAVSDMFAPVSGEVTEVNEKLSDEPEIINKDPYGEGWFIKIKLADSEELESLLSAEDYKDKIS